MYRQTQVKEEDLLWSFSNLPWLFFTRYCLYKISRWRKIM